MRVVLVIGPMFAGKTSRLMKEYSEQDKTDTTCIIVSHASDTRYDKGETIVNHDGVMITKDVIKTDSMKCIPKIDPEQKTWIGIDEAQFFPDVVEFLRAHKKDYPKLSVVLSGLNGDFRQEPIGVNKNWLQETVALASDIVYLKARCWKCGGPATFSIRKKVDDDKEQIKVGGAEIYTAACADHLEA